MARRPSSDPLHRRPADPVLIAPDCTRRDADEPHVERPGRVLARNADGTLQVAYVREGQFVVDPKCQVKREGWGCCWPLEAVEAKAAPEVPDGVP